MPKSSFQHHEGDHLNDVPHHERDKSEKIHIVEPTEDETHYDKEREEDHAAQNK